jgi:hypothetical protein
MLMGGTSQTSNENQVGPSSNGANPNTNMPPPLSPTSAGKLGHSDNTLVPSSFAMMESRNPVAVKPVTSQMSSATGMEELLTGDVENDDAKKLFADFVRAHYASDSLHFYDAVAEYEQLTTAKLRKKKGEAIMKKFIVDGAAEAIDLPSELRQSLLATHKSGSFASDTFARAKQISFDLLKSNFYHKFKNTQDF